jgi:hypothetical protein
MRKGKIIIMPSSEATGHHYVVVKAKNGETLLTSELVARPNKAQKNIRAAAEVFNSLLKGEINIEIGSKKSIEE